MPKPNVTVGEPLGAGSGTITNQGIEQSEAQTLAETIANDYLVEVGDSAPCICIDGRPCSCTMATAETVDTQPGPSLSGGALITAYAAAELAEGYFGTGAPLTTAERQAAVGATLTGNGIVIGAHVSDGAVADGFRKRDASGGLTDAPQTGCGANDSFPAIMTKMGTDRPVVEATTAALLGSHYDAQYARFVAPADVAEHVQGYNSRQTCDAVAASAEVAGSNVEVLQGKHAETMVVFNYQAGTTVDRDRLVAETGKQVFVVDMWYVNKLARAMAFGRPDAETMELKLQHAMVAFQVATYLQLCDGSHRPVILTPTEATAAVAN